jgi:hypothetical protein
MILAVMLQLYNLQPSKILTILVLLMHLGALMSILCAKLGWLPSLSLILLIGCSLLYTLRYYCFKGPGAIRELACSSGDHWILRGVNDELIKAELDGRCFITNYLIILFFRSQNKKYHVVILPDSLEPNEFRRLMVEVK